MQFRSCFRITCPLVAFVALASMPQTLREAANASGILIGTAAIALVPPVLVYSTLHLVRWIFGAVRRGAQI